MHRESKEEQSELRIVVCDDNLLVLQVLQEQFATAKSCFEAGQNAVSAVSLPGPVIQCPISEDSRRPHLLISNEQLTETGKSILGKKASGSIQANSVDKEIQLTIMGIFRDADGQLLINGEFIFGSQTGNLSNGVSETVVNLPYPDVYVQKPKHIYNPCHPFGMTVKEF